MTRPPSPTGAPAVILDSASRPIALQPLARDICTRYHQEFPDEAARYGDAGQAWCLHDNQFQLAWAIQDARDGTVELSTQVVWLASVLAARDFPLPRLARNLQIASEVTADAPALGDLAAAVSKLLLEGSITVAEEADRRNG